MSKEAVTVSLTEIQIATIGITFANQYESYYENLHSEENTDTPPERIAQILHNMDAILRLIGIEQNGVECKDLAKEYEELISSR